MARYSLIAKNIIDGKQTVLIPKKSLVEIDRFIYETFSDSEDVCKYFNISTNVKLYVVYTYNKVTKYLNLLYKNNFKHNISTILNDTNGSNINEKNNEFINIFNDFMNVFTIDEINYLFNMDYIDKKLYDNLFAYRNLDPSNYQSISDRNDIRYSTKYMLQRYLNFRKLMVGLQKYKNRTLIKNNDVCTKKVISTDDELLNNLFNNGDMDSVYSNYDLDDLSLISGSEQLPVDVLRKK